MITPTDAINTIEFEQYFVILPSLPLWDVDKFAAAFNGKRCPDGFHYSSSTNTEWLSIEAMRPLLASNFAYRPGIRSASLPRLFSIQEL